MAPSEIHTAPSSAPGAPTGARTAPSRAPVAPTGGSSSPSERPCGTERNSSSVSERQSGSSAVTSRVFERQAATPLPPAHPPEEPTRRRFGKRHRNDKPGQHLKRNDDPSGPQPDRFHGLPFAHLQPLPIIASNTSRPQRLTNPRQIRERHNPVVVERQSFHPAGTHGFNFTRQLFSRVGRRWIGLESDCQT